MRSLKYLATFTLASLLFFIGCKIDGVQSNILESNNNKNNINATTNLNASRDADNNELEHENIVYLVKDENEKLGLYLNRDYQSDKYEHRVLDKSEVDQLNKQALLQISDDTFIVDYGVSDNDKSIIFLLNHVMIPQSLIGDKKEFFYNLTAVYSFNIETQNLELLFSNKDLEGKRKVITVGDITDQGFLEFNLYSCDGCEDHQANTLLWNSNRKEFFDIGQVADFRWLDNGQYEYKDFILKDCKEQTIGDCNIDPEDLPWKSDKI